MLSVIIQLFLRYIFPRINTLTAESCKCETLLEQLSASLRIFIRISDRSINIILYSAQFNGSTVQAVCLQQYCTCKKMELQYYFGSHFPKQLAILYVPVADRLA